jgi:hypothetical protein
MSVNPISVNALNICLAVNVLVLVSLHILCPLVVKYHVMLPLAFNYLQYQVEI